jgi:hypothetical protein
MRGGADAPAEGQRVGGAVAVHTIDFEKQKDDN